MSHYITVSSGNLVQISTNQALNLKIVYLIADEFQIHFSVFARNRQKMFSERFPFCFRQYYNLFANSISKSFLKVSSKVPLKHHFTFGPNTVTNLTQVSFFINCFFLKENTTTKRLSHRSLLFQLVE